MKLEQVNDGRGSMVLTVGGKTVAFTQVNPAFGKSTCPYFYQRDRVAKAIKAGKVKCE